MEEVAFQAVEKGGAVVVCLVLVFWFLRHIKELHESYAEKTEKSMKAMAAEFNAEHVETRNAFQKQIESLTDRVFEIAHDTALALRGLESAVRDLQRK